MKKFAIIITILLSFGLLVTRGQALFYTGATVYQCTSTEAGFILTVEGNTYHLTGPVYVPRPGYTATLSDLSSNAAAPQDPVATLTLTPPSNIVDHYEQSPLTVVQSLEIDRSFVTTVPIRQLTINIINPVNSFDKQITCQLTGATQ